MSMANYFAMQSINRSRLPRNALLALAAFWLAIMNGRYPVLRLSTGYANELALWLLLLLPWCVAVAALALMRGRLRWLVFLLAIPSIAIGAVPLLGASFELVTTPFGEEDLSFMPL